MKKNNNKKMHHLAWCGITILSSIIATLLLRPLVTKVSKSQQALALYYEFAGNFVAAVAAMELSVISYAKYDVYIFFACLYIMVFLKFYIFGNMELFGSPLTFLDLYYAKDRKHVFTLLELLSVIVTQAVATWCGIVYTKQLWIYEDIVHKNLAEEVCLSTISSTHVWYECFATEMLGTFVCTLVDFNMFDSLKPFTRPLMIMFVVMGFGHVTGTWMNPVLASVFTFRCEGHSSDLLHVAVFWIAPLVGLFLAWELHFILKNLFTSSVINKKESAVKKKDASQKKKKPKKD